MSQDGAEEIDWSSQFFNLAGVMLLVLGPDGRVMHINQAGADILGLARHEIRGQNWFEAFLPERVRAEVRTVCETVTNSSADAPERHENPVCRADGSERLIVWRKHSVCDAAGKIVAHLAAGEDVTDLRRIEALRADAELQRLALDAAKAGVWQWDAATNQQLGSPEVYYLHGLDPADGPPDYRTYLERCVHRDDRPLFEAAVAHAVEAGSSDFRIMFRTVLPGGGIRWLVTRGYLVCDAAHRPLRAYGIVMDVTEQHALEAAVRESEERLRLAMVAGGIGLWDWDVVAEQCTVSENFAPLEIARSEPSMTPAEVLARIHAADRPSVKAQIDRAVAGGPACDIEFRIHPDGGDLRWIAMRASVQHDPAGHPIRLIGVDRDVTAEKAALEESRRLAGELDHRTRNILALVQAIAAQTLTPGPEQEAFLGRLSALGHAHGLAVKRGAFTDLAALVTGELDPYPAERASCSGPPLPLTTRAAQALAMVLHELTTNAVKHGALAEDEGHLSVVWSVEIGATEEPLLQILWSEVTERPVTPPERRGSGSKVIEGSIAHELGGTVEMNFLPAGLRATLTIPLSKVAATPPGPTNEK